ncbi:hypothetical protein M527_25560 [Sphingobium indicum IP26]|nr:hypothetical protein M527_25560 [Sphingobium indicum IP26]
MPVALPASIESHAIAAQMTTPETANGRGPK